MVVQQSQLALQRSNSSLGTPLGAPGRIESLEGYRAIAATGVLVYHTAGIAGLLDPWQPGAHLIDNLGNFGVAVFFLLSGFLLFRPFAAASLLNQPMPATAPFYTRRLLRIFPAYWLALLAWSLAAEPIDRVAGTTVGKLFLVDLYDPRVKTWSVGLGVAWTLTIELSFYLVLPLYALVVSRIAGRREFAHGRLRVHLIALALVYATGFVYRWWQPHWKSAPILSATWLPAFFDWFALGMLLGLASAWIQCGGRIPAVIRDFASRTWACWACAALSYAAIVLLKGNELHFERIETPGQMSWRFLFQGAAALFFLLPAVLGKDSPALRGMRSRPLVFVGLISYGIYLWHPVVALWTVGLADSPSARDRFVVLTAVTLALTIPIAAVSFFGFERPISNRYARGRRERATPQARPEVAQRDAS